MMFPNLITGKFQSVYVHVRVCVSPRSLALYIASPFIYTKTLYMITSFDSTRMNSPPEVHDGEDQPPTTTPATTGEPSTITGEPIPSVPNPHVVTPNSPPGFSEPGPPGFAPETGPPVSDAQPLQALSSQGSPPKPPAKKPRTGSAPPAQLSRSLGGATGALVPSTSGRAPLATPLAVGSAGAPTPSTLAVQDLFSRPNVPRPTLSVWGPDVGYGFTPRPVSTPDGTLHPAWVALPHRGRLSVFSASVLVPPAPNTPVSHPIVSQPADQVGAGFPEALRHCRPLGGCPNPWI